jgi:hypothetical protein
MNKKSLLGLSAVLLLLVGTLAWSHSNRQTSDSVLDSRGAAVLRADGDPMPPPPPHPPTLVLEQMERAGIGA